ncbi:rhamnogalacturonan lyase B N-terminal domain-containing protein [Streptomyces sp. NRRL WC-3742]|uniref:rhamnogalacturonan lyase B N-terminal domain-containing protein n=1 Tax=Streptomyces sp. NRRL WC-3742 TaxID=1463934 RepID=UPI0004C8C825|nr:rhamnogalacturonan lyase B N-terminal domain-containing protein [Streptomyces sp. NRRL WC-3742]
MSKHRPSRRRFLARAGAAGIALGGAAAGVGAVPSGAQAATTASGTFGYTDDGREYTVNTGADLVFRVSRSTGDLTSLIHRGIEYQGYGGKNSQVESGLGPSTVGIAQYGRTVLVSVAHGTLRHYYAAREGENNVYLWTDKADDSITVTRYIVRVRPGLFPNTDPDSWDATRDVLIEAQDVRRRPDGTTRSKHYSNQRVVDYRYVGWSKPGVGLWMVRGNHEKASGGPFYRSLMRHSYEDGAGLYEILYYGENQTEPMRFGLQGPYVLAFTDGGAPSPELWHDRIDTSWVDDLGLEGWVGDGDRGAVAGVGISGRNPALSYTVGFANDDAQYWATAEPSRGAYIARRMLPGDYTWTVYQGELAVRTGTVTVQPGSTTALHTITLTPADDPGRAPAIWRIGSWDGTPAGFRNADLVTHAHPSDVRADPWTGDFTVGRSTDADFPAYQWRDVNDGRRITFDLTEEQAAHPRTLNIGITTAFLNGRPRIQLNDWTSPVPAPHPEPSTRSLTVGSYRGNNHTYTFTVPASALRPGTNTLTITVASGSSGSRFLSPGFAYDCVELLP